MARDIYALEGPESTLGKQIGAVMAAAMQQRTAGRGNIVEAPGARLAAGEAAMAEDLSQREYIQNIHAMRRVEDRDIARAQREASMAAATGRGLQFQPVQDQIHVEPVVNALGYTGEMEDRTDAGSRARIDAQRSEIPGTRRESMIQSRGPADAPMIPDNLISGVSPQVSGVSQPQGIIPPVTQVDTSGTPGGFTVTGDNPYVQNLQEQEQFPQAFAGEGSSQFGGTELGMVPEGRRSEQGFSAKDYTAGGPEALGKDMGEAVAVDTVARNALQWVNDLFKKDTDEQQKGAETGQKKGGVTATGLGTQDTAVQGQSIGSEMTPEEAREVQRHQRNLEETRPGNDAAATVSHSTLGDQGAQVASGGNADEVIGSLLQKYGSQLQMAGYGEQVKKFASGNYTKADIDGLIGQFGSYLPKDVLAQLQQVAEGMVEGANVVAEEVSGLDPNYSRFQGTTSSGSSSYGPATDIEGNKLGFQAKNYNPEVGMIQADKYGRLQEEDFMDYTKRMHKMRYPDQ